MTQATTASKYIPNPNDVRYLSDTRYPGPHVYPCPPEIKGIPSQAELDAYPRMFTWGELKETLRTGKLERLMRNKEMQARYDAWVRGIKGEYGTTENYLVNARFPWPAPTSLPSPTPIANLEPTGRASLSANGSGTSTPSSAGFVSLSELSLGRASNGTADASSEPEPAHLRYDPAKGLDHDVYAVLPNEWPYCVPYGVRHFCVWSKVPIAHPKLVNYDPIQWARIEQEGLSGFTGIIPILQPPYSSQCATYESDVISATIPPPSPPPITAFAHPTADSTPPHAWLAVDAQFGGDEFRRWAGKEYLSPGGQEVQRMVMALWDERGWECLWFVNPPRLQSVPGFSHYHVFARRKTPEEIDASEAAYAARAGCV